MAAKRKVHTAAFETRVALAAKKGDRTVNKLAGHHGVHRTPIPPGRSSSSAWRMSSDSGKTVIIAVIAAHSRVLSRSSFR
jgi:hypothetical protein